VGRLFVVLAIFHVRIGRKKELLRAGEM